VARPAAAGRLLAAAACLALSGCSFATVQRARPPAEVEDPRVLDPCTSSPAAPVVDSALAGIGLGVGYLAAALAVAPSASCPDTSAGTSSCRRDSSEQFSAGMAAMAAGGVSLGSAIYGHISTGKCRRRLTAGRRCANGDLWMCQKLSPRWAPPAGWRAPGAVLEPRPASTATLQIPPPWNAQPAPAGDAPAAQPAAPGAR
jgi:hypothetical protein